MALFRSLRISLATTVALTSALPMTLAGCITKDKAPEVYQIPLHGDPAAPPPPLAPHVSSLEPILLFDKDKWHLRPEAKSALDQWVMELKKHPKDTVCIEGHTSDAGPAEYNMALGLRRAQAAKAYLVEQGIAAERIEAISKGESEPRVPNDSLANEKLNQRAMFSIIIHP